MSTAYRDCPDTDIDDERLEEMIDALIDALEEKLDHDDLPDEEWAAELLRMAPQHYAERKLPAKPCRRELSIDARLTLMRIRVAAGRKPIHPEDSWVKEVDFAGGFVLRRGRNGSIHQAEGVTRG